MAYSGIVSRLTNVRSHPNADRLKLATVAGSQIIVGLDSKDGDLGIFFGPDGKLSPQHLYNCNLYSNPEMNKDPKAKGYFGKNGRIRAQKLRGQNSDGFWQEMESFKWAIGLNTYPENTALECNFNEGDEITHINGNLICEKYYTPATIKAMNKQGAPGKKKKKKPQDSYENFHKHYDTKQLRQNVYNIPKGANLFISEKLHGTSGRTGRVWVKKPRTWLDKLLRRQRRGEWRYVSGSRNVILRRKKQGDFYGFSDFRGRIHDNIEACGLLKGETLYYEIVGYADNGRQIMPSHGVNDKAMKKKYGDKVDYFYGCEPGICKARIYRITSTNEDGDVCEYSWPQVRARCTVLGLETVPEIVTTQAVTSPEMLLRALEEYAKGESILGGKIKEGIVVRVEHEDMFQALKLKSWEFMFLEGIIKNDPNYVDTEEIS